MNKWHHQKGMTAIGWLMVLGLIAFFALVALRMVPAYLEFYKVASAIESLETEPGITQKTKSEIVKMVGRRFEINDVNSVAPGDIKVSKEKGVMTISINYERREHVIGNVDLIATFDKKVEVVSR